MSLMSRILVLLATVLFGLSVAAPNSSAQTIYKDVPFDGEGHLLDIYAANSTGPVVFYVPGGNWYKHDKNLYTRLGTALAAYGINLVVPQYGAEQRYPGNLIDVAEAIRWSQANLANYGIATTKFHLVGHSAGAHLSYMLFSDGRSGLSEGDFHSLTLISGLYDINLLVRYGNRWRNWGPMQGWHASPIKTKRLVCLPLTIIYAEKDYDVVKRQTKHFMWANSHIGQPYRCFVIPNDDHVTELLNAETNGLLRIVIDTAMSTATGGIVSVQPAPALDMIVPAEPMIETQSVVPAPESIPAAPSPEATSPLSLEPPPTPALETPEALPAGETPKIEAPKVEAPKVEAPKIEAPEPLKPAI
ncbi:carboxylesterase family protein [bacterium]|nr:carboxylesterase family protein [bacterium]